jgi:predicted lysophospholipase L1 biosynthesis ABC-type transport system permease subunit
VDPLVAAGWKGVALLAAVITVLAAFIGYAGAQAAHARRTGAESVFILALGLSRGHFLRMLIVEHLTIGIAGIALGIFGGSLLTTVVVDAVSHTERGGLPLPPIQLVTSWTAFAVVVGGLATTFIFSIAMRAKSQIGPAHGAIVRIGIRETN